MIKDEFDFDTWFEILSATVLDKTGVEFSDEDSVRGDYEDGKSCADVADDIAAEYGAFDLGTPIELGITGERKNGAF